MLVPGLCSLVVSTNLIVGNLESVHVPSNLVYTQHTGTSNSTKNYVILKILISTNSGRTIILKKKEKKEKKGNVRLKT